jgi:hypothetical protein
MYAKGKELDAMRRLEAALKSNENLGDSAIRAWACLFELLAGAGAQARVRSAGADLCAPLRKIPAGLECGERGRKPCRRNHRRACPCVAQRRAQCRRRRGAQAGHETPWSNITARPSFRCAAAIRVALGGDGQVTLGNIVVKASARKVRRLYQEKILAGFAGGTADAFTLFERFEAKLEKHQGNLLRARVELAKDWRTDRILRRLEAMLAVADRKAR